MSNERKPIVLPKEIGDKPVGFETETGKTVSLRDAVRLDKEFPGRVRWLFELDSKE